MKLIQLSILALAAAIGIYTFSGCSGETGPQGPTGNNGANGTANVAAYPFTVYDTNWVVNSKYAWEIDFYGTVTGINTSGAMECFYSTNDTNWTQLPWVTNGNSPFFEQAWTYNASGDILISWYNITPGSVAAVVPPLISYFNVVSIPAAIMIKHPNTNWNIESEVAQLPEVQAALNKSK